MTICHLNFRLRLRKSILVDDTVVPEIEGDVFPGEAEEMQEDDDRLDD